MLNGFPPGSVLKAQNAVGDRAAAMPELAIYGTFTGTGSCCTLPLAGSRSRSTLWGSGRRSSAASSPSQASHNRRIGGGVPAWVKYPMLRAGAQHRLNVAGYFPLSVRVMTQGPSPSTFR